MKLNLAQCQLFCELMQIADNSSIVGAVTKVKKQLPSFKLVPAKEIKELLNSLEKEGICHLMLKSNPQNVYGDQCIVIDSNTVVYTYYLRAKDQHISADHRAKSLYSMLSTLRSPVTAKQLSLFDEEDNVQATKDTVVKKIKYLKGQLLSVQMQLEELEKLI